MDNDLVEKTEAHVIIGLLLGLFLLLGLGSRGGGCSSSGSCGGRGSSGSGTRRNVGDQSLKTINFKTNDTA